ncbi:MAG: transposase, partial [Phycisphaerae bacterium]
VLTDAHGTPLVVKTAPANINDGQMAIELLNAMPRVPGPRGRPREKPEVALGDRAYGTAENIDACRDRGIFPLLARPRTEHGSGLGVLRYVVESCLSWFSNFRRLKLCYERTGAHFQAFHDLAAVLICAKKLEWI